MKTPIFLVAAALILWGWQTGFLGMALLMAVLLEGARWVPWRLDWAESGYARAWDFSVACFGVAAVICYLLWPVSDALLRFLQVWPLTFFPFMAAQAYGQHPRTGPATFLWLLRGRPAAENHPVQLNASYAYFALCLLSASAVSDWTAWFYPAFCVLCGWALWRNRSRRWPAAAALLLLVGLGILGHFGHAQLRAWHLSLEKYTTEWMRLLRRSGFDDLTAHTSLGRVGELKESRRILLQWEPDDPDRTPPLLRQASYNKLYYATWFGAHRQFFPIPSLSQTAWKLVDGPPAPRRGRVFTELPGGRGLLPLPPGTQWISDLPALELRRTQFGAVNVEGSPGLVHFQVRFGSERTLDQAPVTLDLVIPPVESNVIQRVAAEIGLHPGMSPPDALSRLANFFHEQFHYTLFQGADPAELIRRDSVLDRFLLQERSGHCEYFATATVLLLRQAGIPARYATGFAVLPQSRVEDAYLVRERDAHAWALAFLDGAWRDVDFTPADWVAHEQASLSWGADLWEWWARRWFRFRWWRTSSSWGPWLPLLIPLTLLSAAWLSRNALRVLRRTRPRRVPATASSPRLAPAWPGRDSDFYRLEALLHGQGWGRSPQETPREWLGRLARTDAFPGPMAELRALVELHYRLRFDPQGLSTGEREMLGNGVKLYVARLACTAKSAQKQQ